MRDRARSLVHRVTLGRGAVLTVREAVADDARRLATLFDRLSDDDRYRRFFSPFRPDDEFLHRLATANEHGACELVAVRSAQGSSEIVGEAGAWPLPNGNGELGITVEPDRRGWLGPFLLDALTESAAARGMPNLEADVLTTNRAMLALLRARGCVVVGADGFSSIRLAIACTGDVPTWAPGDPRCRLLVETPGGRWAGDESVRRGPMQVVACPGPPGRGRLGCPALDGRPCPLAASADVIVNRLLEGEVREALLDAHHRLHPGVPVHDEVGEVTFGSSGARDRPSR